LGDLQAGLEQAVGGDADSLIAPDRSTRSASFVDGPLLLRGVVKRTELFRGMFSSEKGLAQGLYSLADQGVASITNFATGVIIARASSKEEFGLYMLGFTLILLVTDLQTSLIATPYMVYAPRLKANAHALYAGSTLIHQVVFSLLTMLVLAAAALGARFGLGPAGLQAVLTALAAVISLIMLREFVRRICFARLKLRSAFVFDTCIGGGQLLGLLLLAHFRLLSASTAYWVIGPVCGVAVLCWLWLDRRFYHLRLDESVADLKRNWTFGRWVFASGLLATASTNLYPWLIAFFHGTAAAGVFAACLGVVSASNPMLLGIQNFVGPKIAHEFAANGARALRRLVLKISAVLVLPVSALTLTLVLWGDRFIALLYGHRYAGNGLVVSILALNLLVSAVVFSFSRALFAIERADLDFWFNLAAFLTMATVGLAFVRSYGPLGAAFGLLLANTVTSTIRAGAFLRLPVHSPSALGVD
jgi:O-antigen/teichoic acid export membrane protein